MNPSPWVENFGKRHGKWHPGRSHPAYVAAAILGPEFVQQLDEAYALHEELDGVLGKEKEWNQAAEQLYLLEAALLLMVTEARGACLQGVVTQKVRSHCLGYYLSPFGLLDCCGFSARGKAVVEIMRKLNSTLEGAAG